MNTLARTFGAVVTAICAAMLLVMLVLVFGNVVLRFGFNSGLVVSEELSRWLFVWIIFLGAIPVLIDKMHLRLDAVVEALPVRWRLAVISLGQMLMIYITWLILKGAYAQAMLNMRMTAPVTGLPVAVLYAPAVIFAVCAIVILSLQTIKALRDLVQGD